MFILWSRYDTEHKQEGRLIPERQKGRGNKKYKNQNRAYRNKLT